MYAISWGGMDGLVELVAWILQDMGTWNLGRTVSGVMDQDWILRKGENTCIIGDACNSKVHPSNFHMPPDLR